MSFLVFVTAAIVLGFTLTFYASIVVWAVMSSRAAKRRRSPMHQLEIRRTGERSSDSAVGVSVIVPVYNEGPVVIGAIRNLLLQTHKTFEIIVVDDGSTDDTFSLLDSTLELKVVAPGEPGPIETSKLLGSFVSTVDDRIRVLRQTNSGSKAGGTNTGINQARYPWVVIRDGDELMEPDVLARCMTEVEQSTGNVVAVGASILPSNDCVVRSDRVVDVRTSRNLWVGVQTIEYLVAFFLTRPGMGELGLLPFVSGGFGMFRRQALIDVGGLVPDHLGEDLEVCLQIHEYHLERGLPYEVRHVPEALVWTELPATRQQLRRQRRRWQWGLQTSIRSHRQMLTDPTYGRAGRFGYGNIHVFEWWGAHMEALGWLALLVLTIGGWLDHSAMLAMFISSQALGAAVMSLSILLTVRRIRWFDRPSDLLMLFVWVLVSGLGYRQLNLVWRIIALGSARREWGEMERVGFDQLGATA